MTVRFQQSSPWSSAPAASARPLAYDKRDASVPPLRIATARQIAGPLVWFTIERAIANKADVIVLPEWVLKPERDYAAFKRDVERLRDLSHGRLIVPGTFSVIDRLGRRRNLALAFADGRVIYTYGKRADGGDVRHAAAFDARWEPGTRPGIFEWRGMRVGIEICADHREKLLQKDAANGPPLDLQILTADGMDLKPDAVAVGNGGLVIVADMRSISNGGYRLEDGKFTRLPRFNDTIRSEIMLSTFAPGHAAH